MTAATRGLVLGPLLLALLVLPASGQSSPCVTGGGMVKSSAIGGEVMREGTGLGAVSLGATASDVERAWGPPGQCRPQGSGVVYQYFIQSETDDSALLLVVDMESGRVDGLLAMLLPHSRGRGPSLRTGRGVALVAARRRRPHVRRAGRFERAHVGLYLRRRRLPAVQGRGGGHWRVQIRRAALRLPALVLTAAWCSIQ